MTRDLRFDWEREARIGVPEAVLAESKSSRQILATIIETRERRVPLLITRLALDVQAALLAEAAIPLDHAPLSRTAIFGRPKSPAGPAEVEILSSGWADLPVALEVERCLGFFGLTSRRHADVGVPASGV